MGELGGIYIDGDVGIYGYDHFVHKFEFFTFTYQVYGERRLETCTFAAKPNHPFIIRWFHRVVTIVSSKQGDLVRGKVLND